MDAPLFELLALKDSAEIGRWSLPPGRFTLGRSPDCSIPLEADGVADEHAELSISDDGTITLEVGLAGATVEGSSVTGAVRVQPEQYIVPVHDAGIDVQGRAYYTMKLVKGITLKKVLERLKKEEASAAAQYPLLTLLTIYQKVCDAVAFAHSKGVIHRDLKPENIMIGAYGEVLVMDWGLARLFRQRAAGAAAAPRPSAEEVASARLDVGAEFATMAGSIVGTPAYMAPEQARGELDRLDPRTDIFALGVILYEILTLARPFTGKNGDEIIQSICSGKRPALPSSFQARGNQQAGRPRLLHLNESAVPESLSAVTMRALEHCAEDRYQEVEALQADLTAYQNGFATSAEKAGTWKQVKLLVKRNKAAALGIAAVLVVGATLGTQAVIEGRRAERGETLAKQETARAKNEATRAEREEAAAKATPADLRRTAPVFYEQAKTVFRDGNLKEAITKIGYAIQLDDENPDYHLFQANIRQSSQDLAAAAHDYRRVLTLRPKDEAARTNLTLCEKLLGESGGGPLSRAQQNQLLAALRKQMRIVESAPLAAIIDPDTAAAEAAILDRLRELQKQPRWKSHTTRAVVESESFQMARSRLT